MTATATRPNFVGGTIKKFRERLGINRAELARRMNRQRCVINRWEAGHRGVFLDELPMLAKSLGVTPSEFADEMARRARKSS